MAVSIDVTRAAWKRAAGFPASKEAVYVEHAAIQEFIQHAGARVFEYGCGGGSDALSYLRRRCKVWYADVVPENIAAATARIAQAHLEAEAHPVLLEASAPIPLAGEYFAVVNSHGVVHHIEDPAPVVAEFARLLHGAGVCYVMLYTETLYAAHEREINALIRAGKCQSYAEAFGWCTDGPGTPYARAYTEEEGRALLEAAKLQVVSVKTYHKGLFRTFKAVKPGEAPPPPRKPGHQATYAGDGSGLA